MNKEVDKEFAKMVLSLIKDNKEFMNQVEEFMKSHKECWKTCDDGHSQLNSLNIGIHYHDDDIDRAKPWFNVSFGCITAEAFDYADFSNMTSAIWWKDTQVVDEEIVHIKQDEQQQELPFDQD